MRSTHARPYLEEEDKNHHDPLHNGRAYAQKQVVHHCVGRANSTIHGPKGTPCFL